MKLTLDILKNMGFKKIQACCSTLSERTANAYRLKNKILGEFIVFVSEDYIWHKGGNCSPIRTVEALIDIIAEKSYNYGQQKLAKTIVDAANQNVLGDY